MINILRRNRRRRLRKADPTALERLFAGARLVFAAPQPPSARNKEKGQSNRDQIFAGSDEEVLDVQIIH